MGCVGVHFQLTRQIPTPTQGFGNTTRHISSPPSLPRAPGLRHGRCLRPGLHCRLVQRCRRLGARRDPLAHVLGAADVAAGACESLPPLLSRVCVSVCVSVCVCKCVCTYSTTRRIHDAIHRGRGLPPPTPSPPLPLLPLYTPACPHTTAWSCAASSVLTHRTWPSAALSLPAAQTLPPPQSPVRHAAAGGWTPPPAGHLPPHWGRQSQHHWVPGAAEVMPAQTLVAAPLVAD